MGKTDEKVMCNKVALPFMQLASTNSSSSAVTVLLKPETLLAAISKLFCQNKCKIETNIKVYTFNLDQKH